MTPPGTSAHPEYGCSGLIVICTKDRPKEIRMSCESAHQASPGKPILVLDASINGATEHACRQIAACDQSRRLLIYRRAIRPGLARQRNEAVGTSRALNARIIHFIDDDTEVRTGYFDAIERRFDADPGLMGVGGVVVNQPAVNYVKLKRLFLLGSNQRGSVLRSGRNVLGQYPGTADTDRVDWLSGCSMSFRSTVFDEFAFDDELEDYSMGEDYDFSFRVSRDYRLAVEPGATCIHHATPTRRDSVRSRARERTQATHRWVGCHRELGMSQVAFWWSTLGDFVLHLAHGALRAER